MKHRVIGNRILVRLDPAPTETKGGILIPHPEITPFATGEVIAVGYLTGDKVGERTPIPGLSVHDHVLFSSVHKVTDSNPKLAVALDDNVVCIRPADVLLAFAEDDLSRIR